MKDEYNFFFNESGEICCRVNTEFDIVDYTDFDAIEILKEIDNFDYSHLNATSRFITLNNDDVIVTIEDISEFFKKDYIMYLNNTLNSINKAISDYQKRRNKRHMVNNLKVQGSRILAGGLVIALLNAAADPGIIKNLKNKDNKNNTSTELEKDSSIGIVKPIDNSAVSVQDINSMLDELDENDYTKIVSDQLDELEESEEIIPEEPINVAYLTFEDKTDSEKFEYAYTNYYDVVEKYANKWGVPTNVMMAMLTQESGGKVPDNLMQIVFSSWIDQVITEYDFVNNRYQSIVLTDEPEKYVGKDITVITRADLKNKVTNISVACAITHYCLEQMEYNIPAAIQSYNQGCNGLKKVFAKTSEETGIPVDELYSDQTNLEFMNYTNILDWGDPEYLTHISWYIENREDITVKTIDENGQVDEITISIAQKSL